MLQYTIKKIYLIIALVILLTACERENRFVDYINNPQQAISMNEQCQNESESIRILSQDCRYAKQVSDNYRTYMDAAHQDPLGFGRQIMQEQQLYAATIQQVKQLKLRLAEAKNSTDQQALRVQLFKLNIQEQDQRLTIQQYWVVCRELFGE